jgi:hypothetical protein
MGIKNYYPWNVQALVDWIKGEVAPLSCSGAAASPGSSLGISNDTLLDWQVNPAPQITLGHIVELARYRRWSFDQTVQWLGITLAHLEELSGRQLNPRAVDG